MPKLLDWLKEKDISHEDAIKILDSYKPELLTEEEKAEKKQEKKVDKPEGKEVEKETEGDTSEAPTKESPETSKLEMEKLTAEFKKTVDEINSSLQDKLKLLRGSPPKGKEAEQPVDNKPTITKNMYEVRI